jgi:hypothetical protein
MKRVENYLMIIALFADGYIIVFNDPHKLLPQTKKTFKSKFEMINMGEIEYFLGIHITHNRQQKIIHFSQTKHINNIF